MKLIAFTPRGYWQSRRNRYDLLVTIVGANWICINYHLQVRKSFKFINLLYLYQNFIFHTVFFRMIFLTLSDSW